METDYFGDIEYATETTGSAVRRLPGGSVISDLFVSPAGAGLIEARNSIQVIVNGEYPGLERIASRATPPVDDSEYWISYLDCGIVEAFRTVAVQKDESLSVNNPSYVSYEYNGQTYLIESVSPVRHRAWDTYSTTLITVDFDNGRKITAIGIPELRRLIAEFINDGPRYDGTVYTGDTERQSPHIRTDPIVLTERTISEHTEYEPVRLSETTAHELTYVYPDTAHDTDPEMYSPHDSDTDTDAENGADSDAHRGSDVDVDAGTAVDVNSD